MEQQKDLDNANSRLSTTETQLKEAIQEVELKATEITKLKMQSQFLIKAKANLEKQMAEQKALNDESIASLENENLFYKAERSNFSNAEYLEEKLREIRRMEEYYAQRVSSPRLELRGEED